MSESVRFVRIEPQVGGNRLLVLSPGVGWWGSQPQRGALVGPGSPVGTLERLNRTLTLILPAEAGGQVGGPLPRDRRIAVEHGQVLLHLLPAGLDASGVPAATEELPGHPPGTDLPEGCRAVVSPTDGVFYRRPSPDRPPFLELGSRVRVGEPVGLVEVMKTFNQVLYGGPGFPDEAEVVEIRCGDSQEVRAGQILLVVR